MPQIREITMGENPSDESLQVSTTSPEQQQLQSMPSRALHVRKTNTKQSESSSRSSSVTGRTSSRPPSRPSSHRGLGSVAMTRVDSRELHVHDQRSVHHNMLNDHRSTHQTVVHQHDQRALQVNVGVDPDQVIAREAQIMSEAHAALNIAHSQVESIRHEAHSHAQGVEHRATMLVGELQVAHQKELEQVQDVAQKAFCETQKAFDDSQQRLQVSEARNRELAEMLESQSKLLESQRQEHQALMGQVAMLQSEITMLRHSSATPSMPVQDQNGAVNMRELMNMVSSLKEEVGIMKGYMSPPSKGRRVSKGHATPPTVENQDVALNPV